ncbi:aminotransferase class I/II-fold pyridoxal phosphate-dependent enzyme [Rhodohalobacter sp. SW132]|uniref:trans-sulfuration enzyme family protein n=1 Tax=Rhodohalobacter sp. SW132 TaxID=2293433 RepID=UPI000E227274|nr:aminotransferase class I/II-fold pyridoxal phosphate-dependent enzyme [Rhodohalobacter sp. SW132]REL24141.1 aminotransferase class I/II-fold pyridoxal phosphate-dependent enzyme [Rhodohalobacter sp. SW132]
MRFETKAIHTGLDIGNPSKAVIPPISPSTIFEIDADGRNVNDLHYTRLGNPNRLQFEKLIETLEEGKAAAAFSSGIAAASAVLQALKPGDHIIIPEDVYAGNRKMVTDIMLRWGLKADFIKMTDLNRIEEHIKPETRLIWIETPSNPMMRITDIEAVAELAKAHSGSQKIFTLVDNTWPSPVNQLPLRLGADLVLHSTSKYFGGHSDILGGALVSAEDDDLFDQIRLIQKIGGAVPSPQDCWMLSRSTRTLAYRMKGHNEHAAKVADFLQNHSKVADVYYPGLESHPGHEIAEKQMSAYGGMISFLIEGDAHEAIRIVGRSKLIKRATSLGGVESTWEHRVSSEGEGSITPDTLIRISVGLEHVDDILEDLDHAMKE